MYSTKEKLKGDHMAKKILIAFDDSENAMRAVNFVGAHLTTNCEVTLLNVLPDTEIMCAIQSPELTPYFLEQQAYFCNLETKKKEIMERELQRARAHLIACGFEDKNVSIQLNKRDQGIARDIIKEAMTGGYELVVLGRKGMSGIKDFLLGSIAQKVLHSVKGLSVLLVE
jgi:nucleotide-binding universal stress UspA family protein